VFVSPQHDLLAVAPISYPLYFDTPAKPYSHNSFLLKTIQNARGVVLAFLTKGLFFFLDLRFAPVSPVFATLTKTWGVYPNYSQLGTRPCKLLLSPRTNPQRPLHPPSHGGTISFVTSSWAGNIPLPLVSKTTERTTGSTARLIQQSARDRRPGPLAIRGRHPASPFLEKGRSGKASSVRLGERSIVGP
jgi:hypothetical protein